MARTAVSFGKRCLVPSEYGSGITGRLFFTREEISDALKNVYDLERLTGRVAFGNINGRQMRQLGQSLSQVPKIIQLLDSSDDEILQNYADDIVDLSDLGQKK